MKIKQFMFCLWFLLAINNKAFSQETNYFSVSPNTASLARDILSPANLSTGKYNVDVPLYTINSKGITIPISINYNTSGIQLDELASWVGLGWNLNIGGAIVLNSKGSNQNPIAAIDGILDFNVANFNLLHDLYDRGGTSLPDEYIINAPGFFGTFKFIDGKAIFNDLQNTKVTMSYFDNVNKTKSYFEVTRSDGTIYRFGLGLDNIEATENAVNLNEPIERISAWYLTEIISNNGTDVISYKYKQLTNASLYPVIAGEKLVYGSLTYPYFNPMDVPTPPVLSGPFTMNSVLPVLATARKQFLVSVTFKNGFIEFLSSQGREDLEDDYKLDNIKIYSTQAGVNSLIHNFSFTYSYYTRTGGGTISPIIYGYLPSTIQEYNSAKNIKSRNKSLKLIQLKDNTLNTAHTFEYENTVLPCRGTTTKDSWGYINANTGTLSTPTQIMTGQYNFTQALTYVTVGNGARGVTPSLTKSGILTKITYPTGGYTVFEYESNSYNIANKTSKAENSFDPAKPTNHIETSTNFTPTNYVPGSGQIEIYFPKANNELSGKVSTVSYDNEIYNRPLAPDLTHPEQTLRLNKEFGNLLHTLKSFSFLYNTSLQHKAKITAIWKESSAVEKLIGGLRIKSVKNYDGVNQLPISFKQYEYVYANELIESDYGIVLKDVISGGIDPRPDMNWRRYRQPYYTISSVFENNLGASPSVNYGKVVERDLDPNPIPNTNPVTYKDNGKVEYYFEPILSQNVLDLKYEPTVFTSPSYWQPAIPASVKHALRFNKYKIMDSNAALNTKKLIYKRDASDNLKLVSSTENISKDINRLDIPYTSVFTMHSFPYLDPSEEEMTSTDPNIQEMVNNQFYYYNNTTAIAKKETVQSIYTEYDSSETPTLKVVTNYFYDNPIHNELTRIETSNSRDDAVKKQLYYPADLIADGIQPIEMQKLIDQNRIGVPIRVKTFINNAQTSETLTKYAEDVSTGNYLLPREIHETKGIATTFPFDNQNRKIEYTLYDKNGTIGNGNVLEFKKSNGIPSTIIWGYNKTQPIAMIENTTYASIPSATILDLQTKSNADIDTATENTLRLALNALKTSLPNAQITTYTYNPLVGVTSISDAKGLTTYYEYDQINRLKFIKDQDLNVLQRYCYNNKGQAIDCSNIATTFLSTVKSGTYTKNDCPFGEAGSAVTYTVAAAAYNSTISQADADAKAQNNVNTNGQNYANTNGTCTPVIYSYVDNQQPFDTTTMRITVNSSTANHDDVIFKFKLAYGNSQIMYKDITLPSGQTTLFTTFSAPSTTLRTLTFLGTEYIP